jgi:hypothetical protein
MKRRISWGSGVPPLSARRDAEGPRRPENHPLLRGGSAAAAAEERGRDALRARLACGMAIGARSLHRQLGTKEMIAALSTKSKPKLPATLHKDHQI